MHIDNIPPSCNIPNDLKSWHWYYGNESRTITVTNISELLDETRCKVYDNGKAIDFTYSAAEGSLSFTLNGGWHNVELHLKMLLATHTVFRRSIIFISGIFGCGSL